MNKQILPNYMKANPNVQITYEWVDVNKAGERELAGFAAGNMADIWEPYAESIPDVARTGRTVPLDGYVASSKLVAKEDFGPGAWNYHFINGKFWSLPYRLDVRGWVYRKSHLDEKGIPVPVAPTWEQNVQLAKDLTVRQGPRLIRAGHSPWESPIRMVQQFVQLLWEAGGEVMSSDLTKVTYASPEGERALQQLIDLHKAAYPNPDAGIEQSPVPYFPAGKVSQYWRNPTVRGEMMQYAKDDYKDVVLAKEPSKGPSGKQVALMFASSWGLSPRGQAKNPDAAWQALEWVAGNPEQVEIFLLSGGFLPCSKKVAQRPVFKEDAVFTGFDAIQAQWGRQMTPWPRTLELYQIFGDKLTEVWLGKSKAKDALESAQKTWTDRIAKAG
jgi:ABC-type glycerol-3-phosphate transport system substrate-binding protein